MARLIVYNTISLDGFIAGPNGEMDWFLHDPAVDVVAHEVYKSDTLLFGRKTYQLFERFWSGLANDPSADPILREVSAELNGLNKLVASRSLDETTWVNSSLLSGDLVDQVRQLKAEDIAIFGSGSVVKQLAAQGLIDQYLIKVTPCICGDGLTMFYADAAATLRLLETWNFDSGNLLLHYERVAP